MTDEQLLANFRLFNTACSLKWIAATLRTTAIQSMIRLGYDPSEPVIRAAIEAVKSQTVYQVLPSPDEPIGEPAIGVADGSKLDDLMDYAIGLLYETYPELFAPPAVRINTTHIEND